ncbi:DYH2 protein, partial [Pseudoatta argentina]
MQRRRNKVKDKPPPDPRREYLDAESSDEAERLGKIYEKNIKRTHFSTTSSRTPIPPLNPKIPQNRSRNKQHIREKNIKYFPGHLQRLIGHSQVPRCCRFLICLLDYGNLPFDLDRTRRMLEDEPNSSIAKSKGMGGRMGGGGPAMGPRRGEGLRNDRDRLSSGMNIVAEVEEVELRQAYRADDLNELVQCVKDMTTLRGLTDDDWTWKCDMDIREFFQELSIPTLCIYHVNGSLTTEFSFPTVLVRELTYFVRQPNEIFYPENFRERILFGSMNCKVENYILDIIQNMFAPIFFAIETWPDSILLPSISVITLPSKYPINLHN